ncbi:hypothetical protein V8E52_011679, partial [Russula decolorans]
DGSIWAPFCSQCDWEVAQWAKMRAPTSSAMADLLAIPEVVQNLKLSYSTTRELNMFIDNLPGRPPFVCKELVMGGEHLKFYCREILPSLKAIFGDPELKHDLVFAPERHFTNNERTCRIYSEMHTGDWWWSVQASLESRQPGATIIPLILSSDKTLLTMFRDKVAYPVYLTIGNVRKDVRRKPSRRAQMLVAYIPITKFEGIRTKTGRRRALSNLFHTCMQHLLAPIGPVGETGIDMMSGDGIWRRCHPIFAIFVGDYPEQVLVSCTFSGYCPKCTIPHDQLGEYGAFPLRNFGKALNVYQLADDADTRVFHAACRETGLKPVYHPFWERLPLSNIYVSITLDILHQMLQGVMKHLISWLTRPNTFGAAEINARCRSLPPNHHIKQFPKGITALSRVSGGEHKNMCRILIGLIINLPLPGGQVPSRVIKAVRALLDFLYIAQLPSQTTDTLHRLDDSLVLFHQNKSVFVDLGVREQFNLPKLHSLIHYQSSITLFGTADNYNTEQSERLHIDFAKDAYRATNRKDEYPQMAQWLERREKVQQHAAVIQGRLRATHDRNTLGSFPAKLIGPPGPGTRHLKMTRNPTKTKVFFEELAQDYGATYFQDALGDFIARLNHPGASMGTLNDRARNTLIPFRWVSVFHKVKFSHSDTSESDIVDAVYVRPEQTDPQGRTIPSRFDTILVRGKRDNIHGVNGHRIAQVRVVFEIPNKVVQEHQLFGSSASVASPKHLAYVEWFSPLSASPDVNNCMYKVTKLVHKNCDSRQSVAIIPIESILCSIHLFPQFRSGTPPHWDTFSVLEQCDAFFVNPFSDRYNYLT